MNSDIDKVEKIKNRPNVRRNGEFGYKTGQMTDIHLLTKLFRMKQSCNLISKEESTIIILLELP
jgi:hypothetical protein